MNTYSKYAPNVFLAKCDQPYQTGDIIEVQTRHGKENECEVHNLIYEQGGFYFYSITRTDGYNAQERAKAKAQRISGYAATAERKSNEYYHASQEGKDFLSLGEPIKVGHHSEKRHRALIDRNWNRMGKSVEFADKAKDYEARAAYWESKTGEINLSMPESIEYFEYKLEKATEYHAGLKSGKYELRHSYSVTYAKKEVNQAKKNLDLARRLWEHPQPSEK